MRTTSGSKDAVSSSVAAPSVKVFPGLLLEAFVAGGTPEVTTTRALATALFYATIAAGIACVVFARDAIITTEPGPVVVDCAGLTLIDSAAAAVLVRAHGLVRADRRELQFVRYGPGIERVLRPAGLLDVPATGP